tara:strand:- start:7 stop:435 length:429 start_codon:yes stop_codon:yes gene_type:complete
MSLFSRAFPASRDGTAGYRPVTNAEETRKKAENRVRALVNALEDMCGKSVPTTPHIVWAIVNAACDIFDQTYPNYAVAREFSLNVPEYHAQVSGAENTDNLSELIAWLEAVHNIHVGDKTLAREKKYNVFARHCGYTRTENE